MHNAGIHYWAITDACGGSGDTTTFKDRQLTNHRSRTMLSPAAIGEKKSVVLWNFPRRPEAGVRKKIVEKDSGESCKDHDQVLHAFSSFYISSGVTQ